MESIELGNADVWDDSALIETWDGALREYKRYHSIHARGEMVDDVLAQYEADQAAAAQQQHEDVLSAMQTDAFDQSVDTFPDGALLQSLQGEAAEGEADAQPGADQTSSAMHGASVSTSGPTVGVEASTAPDLMGLPHTVLRTGQDEGLKNLMMSWYYAGYYTGLYDGQQRATQALAKPPADRRNGSDATQK